MKNESALIFIDGTICDDRHRINLYGTAEFYAEENVMNDKPADHGHVSIKDHLLTDYPDLNDCLVRTPSIESRALNLFVKKGRKTQLKKAFERHFPGKFILFSKQEFLQKNLFGTGTNHSRLESMLGDILAVAVSDAAIHAKDLQMKSEHAGLTDAEMTIPLIAVEQPAEKTGCRV